MICIRGTVCSSRVSEETHAYHTRYGSYFCTVCYKQFIQVASLKNTCLSILTAIPIEKQFIQVIFLQRIHWFIKKKRQQAWHKTLITSDSFPLRLSWRHTCWNLREKNMKINNSQVSCPKKQYAYSYSRHAIFLHLRQISLLNIHINSYNRKVTHVYVTYLFSPFTWIETFSSHGGRSLKQITLSGCLKCSS